MPILSSKTKDLIHRYQEWYHALESPKEEVPTLHVDEVASAVAKFYEKIRGIVDWREEHLLRKSAIKRILKRRVLMEEDITKISESLILELIRGGHFPNDLIPESKVLDVQRILDKHDFLLNKAAINKEEKELTEIQDWLFGIAACEIEEILSPPSKERFLINYMRELMTERIEVKDGIEERTRKNQISIACQQTLFKLDPPLISYHLLQEWYPGWPTLSPNSSQLYEIANNLFEIKNKIEKEFSNNLSPKFYTICEKYDTIYLLLGDIIEKDPVNAEKNLTTPGFLENALKEAYARRLLASRVKIKRAALYSTISIFITKVAIALGLEIPVDKYLTGTFSSMALILNVLVPPLLMAFLVFSIRPPSRENLQRIILEMGKVVYESEQKDKYIIRPDRRRGSILSSVVFVFYLFSFLVSFGIIIWILDKLQFSLLSKVIFLMFISLIAFAGVKLRQRAKELTVQEEKGLPIFGFLELFALPIVQTGKWLSGKLARYNIVIILINALIEMPLQIFLEFLEQWRYFLREKKEKIH